MTLNTCLSAVPNDDVSDDDDDDDESTDREK